jgi:hypothetical protein|nr:MAG TPA: hypothetical protein [Caudoviricetes sp.]
MRFFERPGGFVEIIIPQIVQKENSVPHRQKVKGNEGQKKKSTHTAKGQRERKKYVQ